MPRGNIPATPALRVLRGQASKREAEAVARPREDAPAPPDGLPAGARAEWGRVVPELYARGVYDPALDRAFMVVYCSAWAVYTAALAELATGGLMTEGYRGQVKKSPAHQIARDAAALMLTFGARFGLNPLDRQRLSMPQPDSSDDTFGGLLS
ncbi:phage terminase small subunit P27 family [Streptomyces cynarae]|uniref:Phage terminase small subunit P27 family n=1 Tax=Streptomyces cynarae TaxID=2981134 RepID=A0ABY6E5M5_9ACTN|nr:phage terminase small subunit P27 family [Streptomyces cynarae]UXY21542.1 phage terminase small subunit P27 family [Streptomyces cynarae]